MTTKTTTHPEVHPSKTGLESRFEEELARADDHYIDPNRIESGEQATSSPSSESEDSRAVEEAMHLGA